MLRVCLLVPALMCVSVLPSATAYAAGKKNALASSSAAPIVGPLHRRARAQMKNLDFDAAVPLLEKLSSRPKLSAIQRASVLLDLGISYVNLGEQDKARSAFTAALEFNPSIELPPKSAPKIKALFAEAKEGPQPPVDPAVVAAAQNPDSHTQPVASEPSSTTPATPEITETTPNLPPQPLPDLQLDASAPKNRIALPLTFGAVAVAGLATGIATGISSSRIASDLSTSSRDGAEVDRLLKQRQLMATVSIAGYGVAAAGAVATGLTLLLNRDDAPVTAVGIITPGGASASATVRF